MSIQPRRSGTMRLGFTLVEITIVLAVIGLIISGIFVGGSAVQSHQLINQASDELNMIASNMRNLYANQNSSTLGPQAPLVITPILVQQGVFPLGMLSPQPTVGSPPCVGTVANNPWSWLAATCTTPVLAGLGSAQIQLLAKTATTPAQFVVMYMNVPTASCSSLIMGTSTPGPATGLTQVTVKGSATTSYSYNVATSTYLLPISISNANAACRSATPTVEIDWSYSFNN